MTAPKGVTSRPAAEQQLRAEARNLVRALHRFEQRAVEATEQADLARRELSVLHRKACERFGRDVPPDAMLLDVLELIDIEDGDRWLWRGLRNNAGLPTIRNVSGRGSETSLIRYLAIQFGIIGEDDWGSLYPNDGDAEDINPWHRTLRRSVQPTGNPNRYSFTPEGAA